MRCGERGEMTRMESNAPLPDGIYEAFIVWADAHEDGSLAVDITITSGDRKGEVITVRVVGLTRRDPVHLAGQPCRLRVDAGAPEILL